MLGPVREPAGERAQRRNHGRRLAQKRNACRRAMGEKATRPPPPNQSRACQMLIPIAANPPTPIPPAPPQPGDPPADRPGDPIPPPVPGPGQPQPGPTPDQPISVLSRLSSFSLP